MKKTFFLLISITLIALLSGCGTAGAFHTNHVTNVELSKPNFNIVAKDVQGSSMQGYIFGASISQGSDVTTFGIARVTGVEKLYDTAIKNLWKNYREKYGDLEGKNIALVNVRHDTEVLNTFVYTQAKYFITADVVEFVE
ncbi:MAG: hypothetical protein GY936_10900 [Ignavibacteriae bacterium]|nr:hypothetical protein [Ignavibacteriota bacterium]